MWGDEGEECLCCMRPVAVGSSETFRLQSRHHQHSCRVWQSLAKALHKHTWGQHTCYTHSQNNEFRKEQTLLEECLYDSVWMISNTLCRNNRSFSQKFNNVNSNSNRGCFGHFCHLTDSYMFQYRTWFYVLSQNSSAISILSAGPVDPLVQICTCPVNIFIDPATKFYVFAKRFDIIKKINSIFSNMIIIWIII